MLQLKNITKSYTTGQFTQTALKDINLSFRDNEFVAILGQSGSGKTTFLNVIGGLDQYDSGDLYINGTSTKKYKDSDWDAYRNNSIGFVFQSYNLIGHLSVLDNVEMGMTLSGISQKERREKAIDALKKVDLIDHAHKKPNQLSGGQMQRVAIARALAGDPPIILMDEPTGALDSNTSVQIMDLIQGLAKDKLVIMVTHNKELAETYANRIISFKDGIVVDDTNPVAGDTKEGNYKLKRTKMSFFTALKLSGKNIGTKKWRTALTAFASSIGIIGIALILSLSSGFQVQIDAFQQDALTNMPVIISKSATTIDTETIAQMRQEQIDSMTNTEEGPTEQKVYLYDPTENQIHHTNNFTDDYMDYLEAMDESLISSMGFTRLVNFNLLRDIDGEVKTVQMGTGLRMNDGTSSGGGFTSMEGMGISSYPKSLSEEEDSYLETNYDLLAGSFPAGETDMVLIVDEDNRLNYAIMEGLGFDTEDVESIDFDEIIGTTFELVHNDDFYEETPMETFIPVDDLDAVYESDNNKTLTISGILRLKSDVEFSIVSNGIAYSDELVETIIDEAMNSAIVQKQKEVDYNVFNFQEITEEEKESMVAYLGGDATPYMIFLYPKSFDTKDGMLTYLEDYNVGKSDEDTIVYTDLAATITDMTKDIMDGITIVLIAFASISLIVSLIMIGIITYISVLERTKEIGVLRALGARKKDITRVFNAETFIIGVCSGLLGIGTAYLLTLPTNKIIEAMTGLQDVAQLEIVTSIILITISVTLTLIGGFIPARMASKKDPVAALRTE